MRLGIGWGRCLVNKFEMGWDENFAYGVEGSLKIKQVRTYSLRWQRYLQL